MADSGNVAGNSSGITLGRIALKRGLITPEQLRAALMEQSRSSQAGQTRRPLEAILLEKGFLTRTQLDQVLAESASVGEADAQEAPQEFGKYRLVQEVGHGAMGVVYEALDTELQRKVALKMIVRSPNARPKEVALDEERFIREARLSANLPKHPHIVGVYDAGTIDGRRYIAMEFIDGRPMDEWRKTGSFILRQPIKVLRDVALALHHAHEQGLIHRDVKPANILVDARNQPHVTDFGLAKIVEGNEKLTHAQGEMVVGTPAYMSPEQAQGRTLDRRTDIYSLGAILYEIMTGRTPFEGSSAVEILVKTSKDAVVPPSKITTVLMNPLSFKDLEGVCLKALAKEPGDRYATAEDFADALSRWLEGAAGRRGMGRIGRRLLWLSTAGATLAAFVLLWIARPWQATQLTSATEKTAEKPAPAPPEPPKPAPKATVDLLSSVDLIQDPVRGKWTVSEGLITTLAGKPSVLQLPYHPPEEYDLRVRFKRTGSNFCINLILHKSGRSFTLVMDKTGTFGLERVKGKDFRENFTTSQTGTAVESDVVHTVLVEVRNSGVTAFLDDQPILECATDYADITMNPDWQLRDPSAIGVGAWDGTAVFHRIEVREVTGKGNLLR